MPPVVDPEAVDALLWAAIGHWMHWLWAYLFSVVILAFSFLTAHALIPSLVSSGHLPRKFLKLRIPMYLSAAGFFGLAVFFMVWTVENTKAIEDLYNRFWI